MGDSHSHYSTPTIIVKINTYMISFKQFLIEKEQRPDIEGFIKGAIYKGSGLGALMAGDLAHTRVPGGPNINLAMFPVAAGLIGYGFGRDIEAAGGYDDYGMKPGTVSGPATQAEYEQAGAEAAERRRKRGIVPPDYEPKEDQPLMSRVVPVQDIENQVPATEEDRKDFEDYVMQRGKYAPKKNQQ